MPCVLAFPNKKTRSQIKGCIVHPKVLKINVIALKTHLSFQHL